MTGNSPPNGGFQRFQALHGEQQPGRLAAGRRLLHGADRQVPERLRRTTRRSRPAGPSGTRPRPTPRTSTTTRSTTTAPWSTTATDPADFKQDVLTRKAVGLRRPPGAEAEAVLPLAHLHGAARRRPEPEPATRRTTARARAEAGAAPCPRVRLRAAAEAAELQRGGRLRQAGRDPAAGRCLSASQIADIQRKLPLPARVAALGGRGRQAGGRRAAGDRASSTTRCSSTPPTTASSTASTGSRAARCTSTRSRSGCRSRCAGPGIPKGVSVDAAGDQRRPRAHDRRRGGREPGPDHGRALAAPGGAATPASSRDANSWSRSRSLRGDPDGSATCTPSTTPGSRSSTTCGTIRTSSRAATTAALRVGQGRARESPPPARDLRGRRAAG